MKAKYILAYLLALLLVRCPAAAAAAAAEEDAYILPILMYHEVRETNPGKDSVYPSELEADLRFLRDEGYTVISLEKLLDYVFSGSPLPEKPVILSFDDGCGSFPVHALPLLQRYGAPALLSVIGESTDEFSAYPQTGRVYAHMSWQQLRQALESGLVEPGNHSYALHRLEGGAKGCLPRPGEKPADYEARLTADAQRLQERLREETGQTAAVFTYPYGFYSERSDAILAETGFRATLTCDFGLNRISRDPACLLGLRRICRSHGEDLGTLLEEAASFSGLHPEPEKEKETWNLTACWTTAPHWKPTTSAAGFTNITNGTKQPGRTF